MMGHARIIDMIFEPAHFNPRCNCTIPPGWVAVVEADHGYGYETLPKQIGGSPANLIASLKSNYAIITGTPNVHKIVRENGGLPHV